MHCPSFRTVFVWVFGCLAAGVPALTQYETAAVLGTVRDTSGAVGVNCSVRLQNISRATASTASADDAGNFEFPDVRVGAYNLQARCTGFKEPVTENFAVAVNARQRVDVVMEVGEVTDTVTVTGAASLIESESSDRGQVIGSEPVVDLPLNGRNYADLALLWKVNAHEIKSGVIYKERKAHSHGVPYETRHGELRIQVRHAGPQHRHLGRYQPEDETIKACNGCDVLIHEGRAQELFARLPERLPVVRGEVSHVLVTTRCPGGQSQAQPADAWWSRSSMGPGIVPLPAALGSQQVEALVVRFARENRGWGYDRIAARLPIWAIRFRIERSATSSVGTISLQHRRGVARRAGRNSSGRTLTCSPGPTSSVWRC
jgi:hypothetical protein